MLFADGAGAVVLSCETEGSGIMAITLGADGKGANQIILPAGGSKLPATIDTVKNNLHTLYIDGPDVYKFAVRTIVGQTRTVLDKAGLKLSDLDLLIPHQANIRIIEAAA